MRRVENLISSMIARKGYSVVMRSSVKNHKLKWIHYIDNIQQIDQDLLKNLVVSECEHYGLKYEIKQ